MATSVSDHFLSDEVLSAMLEASQCDPASCREFPACLHILCTGQTPGLPLSALLQPRGGTGEEAGGGATPIIHHRSS